MGLPERWWLLTSLDERVTAKVYMVNSAKTCQQTPLSTRRFDSHQACCSPCCRLYGTVMGHVLYPALRNPDLFFPLQRFVYAQKLECTRANCFLEPPSCNSGILACFFSEALVEWGLRWPWSRPCWLCWASWLLMYFVVTYSGSKSLNTQYRRIDKLISLWAAIMKRLFQFAISSAGGEPVEWTARVHESSLLEPCHVVHFVCEQHLRDGQCPMSFKNYSIQYKPRLAALLVLQLSRSRNCLQWRKAPRSWSSTEIREAFETDNEQWKVKASWIRNFNHSQLWGLMRMGRSWTVPYAWTPLVLRFAEIERIEWETFSQLAEKFLRCWESLVEKWCGYLATTTSTRCKGGDMKDRAKEVNADLASFWREWCY